MTTNANIVSDPRIREALNVVYEYALGNLQARGTISARSDDMDALITGINMLGEELAAYLFERKKSEEMLAESEALFRTVFDHAWDGILIADIETKKFLMGNRMICEMLGYDAEEIRNLSVMDIHPEKDLPAILAQFEQLSKKEIGGLYNLPIKGRGGRVCNADVSASPMTLQGKAYLIGIFRDTTEKRNVEELLRTSEERFRNLVETTNDWVWELDTNGVLTYVSPRAEEALGYEVQDILGKRPFDFMPPEEARRVAGLFTAIMASPKAFSLLEIVNLHRDGHLIYLESSGAPFFDANGNLRGFRGMNRDVTARKQAEERFLKMQEELTRKERLAIIGQLSGSIGHELRSPLGVISNAVYFLKTVLPEADETVKEYLDIIKSETNNAERIITDLLDFSRAKTPLSKRIALDEMIKSACGRCTIRENISLRIELPDASPVVNVDPLHMEQVFRNLITNGIQAMPEGGVLTIRAKEDREDGMVRIGITDTGEGIAPENMKKLFQPLFTTKARGIGLGLVVSRNLVEANGGRIEVESHVGKGTTFTVILPIDKG